MEKKKSLVGEIENIVITSNFFLPIEGGKLAFGHKNGRAGIVEIYVNGKLKNTRGKQENITIVFKGFSKYLSQSKQSK